MTRSVPQLYTLSCVCARAHVFIAFPKVYYYYYHFFKKKKHFDFIFFYFYFLRSISYFRCFFYCVLLSVEWRSFLKMKFFCCFIARGRSKFTRNVYWLFCAKITKRLTIKTKVATKRLPCLKCGRESEEGRERERIHRNFK